MAASEQDAVLESRRSELLRSDSVRVIVTVIRLLVVPAICMPLGVLALRQGLLTSDPLVQVVALIQTGMPTSQSILTFMDAKLGATHAENIAQQFLYQYMFAAISVALWTIVTVYIIEEYAD